MLLDFPRLPHRTRRYSGQAGRRQSSGRSFLLLCCEPEDYASWAVEHPEEPCDLVYRASLEAATARARRATTFGAFKRFCEDCQPHWQQRMAEEGRCVRSYVFAGRTSRPSPRVAALAASARGDDES